MLTTTRAFLAVMLLALSLGAIAACGGDDDGDAEPSVEATTDDGGATTAPEATEPPSATEEDADDEGVVDEGEAPTFEDGTWTGGEAEVNVSGSDTRTITGTLSDESSTEGETTRLIYVNGIDTINVSISNEYLPFDMSVYQEDFSASIPLDAEPCEVTYTEASETRIEATFRCDAELDLGGTEGPVVLEGSLTATR
jgi:hypothetical protein